MIFRVLLYSDALLDLCSVTRRTEYHAVCKATNLELFTTIAIYHKSLNSVFDDKWIERIHKLTNGESLYIHKFKKNLTLIEDPDDIENPESVLDLAIQHGMTHLLVKKDKLSSPFHVYLDEHLDIPVERQLRICQLEDLKSEVEKEKGKKKQEAHTTKALNRYRARLKRKPTKNLE